MDNDDDLKINSDVNDEENGDEYDNDDDDASSESYDCDDEDTDDIDYDNESIDTTDPKERHYQSIVHCLCERDANGFKKLALKNGGFLNDNLRRMIWPRMAKVHIVESSPRPDTATISAHPFYNQVLLDVNRSLKRFPPSIEEHQRMAMQDQLVMLIMRVLIKNPKLYYYQGYHDICVTFLLVMGEENAFYLTNKLSKTHLMTFMDETMEKTGDMLNVIPIIVNLEDAQLGDHIEQSSVGTIFALSWVITWFSHVLKKYDDVGRLFDLFIVSHFWMPLYVTVAIILYKKEEILKLECDMAMVHQYLTSVPENGDLPIEVIISDALHLFKKYPPDDMKVLQEKEKSKRQQMEKRRFSIVKKFSSFTQLLGVSLSKKIFSFTVLIVFCATLIQYYLRGR